MKKIFVFICLFGFLTLPTQASEPSTIEANDSAYAYATTPMQKNGAVFFKLKNYMSRADRLIKASADIAGRVELHTHIMDGDVMMMREVEGYDLPVHGELVLEPTGHHIMLMGLKAPLKAGESFPLVLEFEHLSPMQLTVEIKNPGDVE